MIEEIEPVQVRAAVRPMIRVRHQARHRNDAEAVPRGISDRVRKLSVDVGVGRERLVGHQPPYRNAVKLTVAGFH